MANAHPVKRDVLLYALAQAAITGGRRLRRIRLIELYIALENAASCMQKEHDTPDALSINVLYNIKDRASARWASRGLPYTVAYSAQNTLNVFRSCMTEDCFVETDLSIVECMSSSTKGQIKDKLLDALVFCALWPRRTEIQPQPAPETANVLVPADLVEEILSSLRESISRMTEKRKVIPLLIFVQRFYDKVIQHGVAGVTPASVTQQVIETLCDRS